MREQLNFLKLHGHLDANSYPLGFLREEVAITTKHINRQIATDATLNKLAIHSLFSKEAGSEFTKGIKRLTDG